MWFDVQAALSEIKGGKVATPATLATQQAKTPQNRSNVADVANVATLHPSEFTPDTDAFEERAAIAEFDAGMSRADAEDFAAQGQGYDNVIAFRAAHQRKASNE
ncbi:MAG: hypothetical protein ACSHXD_15135 [Marinosulfonomonas sp.]